MYIRQWLTDKSNPNCAVYFRKEFSLPTCKKVVIETTALGWLRVFMNGKAVTESEFLPGWTDYNKRVPLLRYDVTSLIKDSNAIAAVVGNGWARGSAFWGLCRRQYAVVAPSLYLRIRYQGEDGKWRTVFGDGWKSSDGVVRENDLMNGETQDWNFQTKGFDLVGYDDSTWKKATVYRRKVRAERIQCPKVSVRETFLGDEIDRKDHYRLYDFKQNFSGVTEIAIRVKKDGVLTVRHGEILDENGRLYVENLRGAKAIDSYVLPIGEYRLRPWFTYHGFRFAELTWNGEMEISSCDGLAIYTESENVGDFSCSSALVNRIFQNCVWSQKSNFQYIPTDCPQRDERLGWLGDAGVFARSAMYGMDLKDFFVHYMSLIREATRSDGAIACIAPNPDGFQENAIGASAWSDAALTILSDYYDFYRDEKLLKEYFSLAEGHLKWVEENSENYRRRTYCFSDWLCVNADSKEGSGSVDGNVFDACFYALDCLLMRKFCRILGRDESVYEEKYAKVKNYFLECLYDGNAPIGKGRQTALLLAYRVGFLTAEQIKKTLVADLEKNGLTCGFIGVKHILPVLTELGRSDLAYALITSEKYPSWGYSIKNGATTIWERWDSYTKENGVHPSGMNSFNHFSFGACLEWFYGYVLGICLSDGKICIKPYVDWSGKLTWAKGNYHSVRVTWRLLKDEKAEIELVLPRGAKATYDLSGYTLLSKRRDSERYVFTVARACGNTSPTNE